MSSPVVTPPTEMSILEAETPDTKPIVTEDKPELEETPEEPEVEDEPVEEELEDLPEEPEQESEIPSQVNFSQLKKEFPEVLKKYPELRASYFAVEKYREVFPTIEDAQSASQKAEALDLIIPQVAHGDLSVIVDEMSRGGNQQGLQALASNFLPTLLSRDKSLYSKALFPELKKVVSLAKQAGETTGNDNLKNAAAVLSQFIFGSIEPPADQPVNNTPDPEKLKLQQQNQQMWVQQASNYENDVKETTAKHFVKEIEAGLDPDGKLNDFVKNNLVKGIAEEINSKLMEDKVFQKQMSSLWQNAARVGFTQDAKTRLIRAFLGRAKNLVPAIRTRLKNEALGEAKQLPRKQNVRANSGVPRDRSQKVTSTEVKDKRLSEMDIIMRGA